MLIQPFFVDQKLKSKKIIKGMGSNYSWSQSDIIKGIEGDLKRELRIFYYFLSLKKNKNFQKILVFIMRLLET